VGLQAGVEDGAALGRVLGQGFHRAMQTCSVTN